MKIYARVDNKPVLYVQKKDIKYLLNSDNRIPASIRINYEQYRNASKNLNNFIKITKPSEIGYFYAQYYILELDKINKLSYEQLCELDQVFRKLYNELFVKYTEVRIEKDKKKISETKLALKNLEHLYDDYNRIKDVLTTMNIHDIPKDTDELKEELPYGLYVDYKVQYGLTDNILIISRKDDQPIDYDDIDFDVLVEVIKETFVSLFYDFDYEYTYEDNRFIMNMKLKMHEIFQNNTNDIIRRLKKTV